MIKSEFQDSQRESEMRQLFGLSKDKTEGRSGTDAFLQLDGKLYLFELKSTSKESVTTARDFGPDHIKKWKDKHWIFGFYKSVIQNIHNDRFLINKFFHFILNLVLFTSLDD